MIPLYVEKNGIAYVWNAEDWYTLRSQFRICGVLMGSAPRFPRQNDFLGLPMALESEEAALLVEKGICTLFELPNIKLAPTEEEKEVIKELENNRLISGVAIFIAQIVNAVWKTLTMAIKNQMGLNLNHVIGIFTSSLKEQLDALRKCKIEQLSQKIDIIITGKKQKLLSKGITDIKLDKKTLLEEEIKKLPNIAPAHILTHVPTEHHMATEKKEVGINILRPSVEEGVGAIKYKIFKHLWERQHYITSGSKFGCDYLVYPGDPVRFHATYMVRCICNQTSTVSPAEYVAFGRLSVAVNKLAVLAFINSSGHVDFQTLQWHDSIGNIK